MLFKLFNKRKNWFTLIELLLVCSVFALLVSGVIIAINRAYSFMNDTKVRVRATNFAREGVEMMFNMRDTNWRKHSWNRDENWLCNGTWAGYCWDKLREWIYVIKEGSNDTLDHFFYVNRLNFENDDDLEKFYACDWLLNQDNPHNDESYLQFDWDYNYIEYSGGNRVEQTWSVQDLLTNETDFYRMLRVFGVYCKETNNSNITNTCTKDSDPKEMRFCVKVCYRNGSTNGSSELCSVMTNFME